MREERKAGLVPVALVTLVRRVPMFAVGRLLSLLALSVMSLPVAAYEIPKRSLEARIHDADLVIFGQVVALESSEPENEFADGYAQVRVTTFLKGSEGKTIRVLYRGGISEAAPLCCTVGASYFMILRGPASGVYESVDGPYGVFEINASAGTSFPIKPEGLEDARLLHARVMTISDFPPVMSGIIKTWISMAVVEDGTSTRQELLMVYLGDQQPMPKVRDDCLFTVHREEAGGFVGRGSRANHLATVVDDYRCGSDMPRALQGVSVSWPGIAGP
ncbi:hypothetical protein BJI69_19740 [Luteibacter rhizovicinus DSM 16549]|uniref:Uncharacterized protein n=2 Tax=Luteibacter rhizovicinus TaxID=242606 RepID=A0A0G9HBJ6_9GAMM|nr:hypothetical protein BJI69_19740 [Luteibacter rhizovicinus DSM 16549]KLD67135.1 hypothetical protein Y883_09260 [Luteibacter rhizovicinus DSM 16549]KLD73202.1 hypothetical protein Y886_39320 [Xanthomonas hyacinthi DSM 19077]